MHSSLVATRVLTSAALASPNIAGAIGLCVVIVISATLMLVRNHRRPAKTAPRNSGAAPPRGRSGRRDRKATERLHVHSKLLSNIDDLLHNICEAHPDIFEDGVAQIKADNHIVIILRLGREMLHDYDDPNTTREFVYDVSAGTMGYHDLTSNMSVVLPFEVPEGRPLDHDKVDDRATQLKLMLAGHDWFYIHRSAAIPGRFGRKGKPPASTLVPHDLRVKPGQSSRGEAGYSQPTYGGRRPAYDTDPNDDDYDYEEEAPRPEPPYYEATNPRRGPSGPRSGSRSHNSSR